MNTRLLLLLLFVLTIVSFCAQKKSGTSAFSSHYPAEPTIFQMEKDLEEISCISYQPSDNTVYAISDDKGSLYKVSLSDGKIISKLKFYDTKNFEDLAIVGTVAMY